MHTYLYIKAKYVAEIVMTLPVWRYDAVSVLLVCLHNNAAYNVYVLLPVLQVYLKENIYLIPL